MEASKVLSQDEYFGKLQPQLEERERTPQVHHRSAEIHQHIYLSYFESYCLDELQLEETEGNEIKISS